MRSVYLTGGFATRVPCVPSHNHSYGRLAGVVVRLDLFYPILNRLRLPKNLIRASISEYVREAEEGARP